MGLFIKVNEARYKHGISFVETIVVVGITAVLFVLVLVAPSSINSKQLLEREKSSIISIFEKARSFTLASKGGLSYGVHLASSTATISSGSYVSGASGNEVNSIDKRVAIYFVTLTGGGNDIIGATDLAEMLNNLTL